MPSLPLLPSLGHPPSTTHPSPMTTCSPHTANIAKMHPAPWRRDNSNPSSCNPLNHHPLPYPNNHLKRTAMMTCHRERLRQEVYQVRSFSPIDSWAYFLSIVGCSRTTHSHTSYHGPQWRFLCCKGGLTRSLLSYFPFPVVDFVDLPSTHGCSLAHAVRFFGCSPSLLFLACSSTPTLPLSSSN